MTTSKRVRRGGSWFDDDAANRAARARGKISPGSQIYPLGFRCFKQLGRGANRAFRHGSWNGDVTYRDNIGPGNRCSGGIGLRCYRRD